MEGYTNPCRVEGIIQWKVLIRDHHLFTVFCKRFEEQSNGSSSIMLETIFCGTDTIKSDFWTEKMEMFDGNCCIENLMPILRRKTCCFVMKCPIEKSPNIPKFNECFNLSFVGFDKMAKFITLFILLWIADPSIDRLVSICNDHLNYILVNEHSPY